MINFREKNNIQYVHLMGGLGNQLFQVAAGLKSSLDLDRKLVVDDSFGNFRKNKSGDADILGYQTNLYSTVGNKFGTRLLTRKMLGLLLRISFNSTSKFKKLIARFLRLITSFLLSIKLRHPVKIWSGYNLGFEVISKSICSQYLFGYFQTHKFAHDERIRTMLCSLSVSSDSIEKYRTISLVEKPLVVHIRLSDYLIETKFGILTRDYYNKALDIMFSQYSFKSIWVFSDEIDKAREFIPSKFFDYCRWINDGDEAAVETLEKMRLGRAYIIGNSTFSWWGAFLSHTQNAPIIAPSPWFVGIDDPNQLIPANWVKINRQIGENEIE